MEGNQFEDIFRRLIFIQLFLTSVCVGSLPCMPESDRFGQYKVKGGGGNILSVGIPSGSRVKVSIRCDMGATAQRSVTSQCSNGTWIPPWPRCEKPCAVPRNRGPVRQFVNGDETRPITSYYTPSTLPAGTQLVARCRDPGKYRLIGDQRRTCEEGQWTGEEPECQPVETQFLFYGATREIASNGTIVVYVHRGHPKRLDVVCYITSVWLTPPRLTTPLVNDEDLQHWYWPESHGKRLYPISTDFSGMYTCNGSSSFHSVYVLFKDTMPYRVIAAECEVPAAPVHGWLLDRARQEPRESFPVGATVSFECEDDYSLVGSRRITCEKGQWSDDPPVCTGSTEPPKNNGSCSNSCCTSSEYSCNPEGCYCDRWCESNDNCCHDYEDVCPRIDGSIDVFISNTTYNMRGGERISLSSPNYPKNYNNFENILWHVRNVHGRHFFMSFWNVRLHSVRDYVRIYTGISDVFEESTQIFHLTYNLPGDLLLRYWSAHPYIWLQFSTDAFGTDRGFNFAIVSLSREDCDGTHFLCENGQCIYRSAVCDGFSDCVDSSDEHCAPRNGSCSDSCCVNSEYSCNPDGCYCDSICVDNGNCCDDYSDVCPTLGNGTAQPSSQFTTPSLILNTDECEFPAGPERWTLLDGSRRQPGEIFPDGSTVSFECDYDSRLVGSKEITCEKGQWSDDPPVCTGGNACRDTGCLNRGVCWIRRTTGSFFCRCLPGTSGDQCEKTAECEVPAATEHGRLLNVSREEPQDIFPSGATVSFECEDNYRLVGSKEITCEKGEWSDDPPECIGHSAELDIRLFGGSGNYEGRVEVRVNGRWGTVCNETWDMDDASVVCREIGNRTAVKYDVMYGEGKGPILYTNSTCTGEEERLRDCPNEEPRVDVCRHTQDAGVQCSFKDVDLRLVGGSTANEGRVEVYKKGSAGMGEWGRMCAGSEWDRREANVVCRTVGYPNGAKASSGSFGIGNGRVFITDVECTGTENTFLGCKDANFGNLQTCPTDDEDATVVCVPTPLG